MLSLKQFLLLSLFSLLFSLGIAQSQPYQPQEFSNVEPSWIKSSYDPTAADSADLSGYDHYHTSRLAWDYESLIVDSFIFVATNHFLNYSDVVGFQVEKINLNTGETIWQRVFDLRGSDHPEFVMRLEYLESSDELIVLSAERIQPWDDEAFNFFQFASLGAFSKIYDRRFDAMDGMLLSETDPNLNSDEFPTIENDIYNMHVIRSQTDNPDHLWLWKYQPREFKFSKYNINESGLKQDSIIHDVSFTGIDIDTTLLLGFPNSVMQWQPNNQLATLQVLNNVQNTPSEIESAKIVICDETMNAVESIDLSSFKGYYNLGLLYIDQRITYLESQQSRSSSPQYFILDRQTGATIQELTRRIDPRNIQWLEDRGQYLCIEEDRPNESWDLFFMSPDGEIELLKTIQFEGEYYSAPIEMKVLEDSSLFLRMSQGVLESNGGLQVEYASTFMRLPPEQINLVTLNHERVWDVAEVNIFPNPTQDYLHIYIDGFSGEKYRVSIYDLPGSKRYQGTIINSQSRIDVGDWEQGSYFYQLYQEEQLIKTGFFQVF